jgi:acyl dehydratase
MDLSVVGSSTEPIEVTWSQEDLQLYALAVGAGQEPTRELSFSTENSEGHEFEAIPTYPLVLAQQSTRLWSTFGDYHPGAAVHGRQTLSLSRPWPISGSATITSTVLDIGDRGSAAVVRTESVGTDERGEHLFSAQRWVMVRGEGGFDGPKPENEDWQPPIPSPDHVAPITPRPEQALLYRMCGDRNRLHSDPAYARSAGFDVPILHGLCTLGFAARALIGFFRSTLGAGLAQLTFIDGRFRSPVMPGEELVLLVWREGPDCWFEVRTLDGRRAIDRGRATFESTGSGYHDLRRATA